MLGFVLGLLQMLLYAIYRNRKQVIIEDDEKKIPAAVAADQHVKNVVGLTTLATSEVHPVDPPPHDHDESVEVDSGSHTVAASCA